MANFFALFKVQLLSLLGNNKTLKSKNKKSKAGLGGIALILLLLGGIMVFLGFTYSNIFALSLSYTGDLYKLIPTMIALGSLISFMFSFYAVGSAIFGFKDYDVLASMPIKPKEIVLSKFAVLYVSELFFVLAVVVPSFFVYKKIAGVITLTQIVISLTLCFFSPLLPLAVSTVIGVFVYYVSSRFRRKNIIQIILLFLFLIGIFILSFLSEMGEEDPSQMTGMLSFMEKTYFVFPLALESFLQPIWVLAFIGANVISITAVVSVVCVFYKKLNSIFTAKRTLRNFKLKNYQSNGIGKALFIKELRRLFSSPVYAINSLTGTVMAVISCIAYSIFVCTSDVMNVEGSEIIFNYINKLLPFIFSFMFIMAPSTCCSISLEGQAFWIVKTAPVSYMKVLNIKLAINGVFSTSIALICSIIVAICSGFGLVAGGLFVLTAIGISSFGGIFGLLMNLRFPKMKWQNENVVVKQSLTTFLTILVSLVFSALFIVIGLYVDLKIEILMAIYACFFIILSISLYIVIYKYSYKLISKIN